MDTDELPAEAADEPGEAVEIYLNDHLAGARGALDLMDDILEGDDDEELLAVIRRLRDEVAEDHQALEEIMDRLGVPRQRFKQVLATLAESTSRMKLARAGAPTELSELLELESLSAGIWMKKRLWRALAFSDLAAALAHEDLDHLAARADRQLDAVEELRLRLAPQALRG